MNALKLLKEKLNISSIDAVETKGLLTKFAITDLDCDCVDGDCSVEGYEI